MPAGDVCDLRSFGEYAGEGVADFLRKRLSAPVAEAFGESQQSGDHGDAPEDSSRPAAHAGPNANARQFQGPSNMQREISKLLPGQQPSSNQGQPKEQQGHPATTPVRCGRVQ